MFRRIERVFGRKGRNDCFNRPQCEAGPLETRTSTRPPPVSSRFPNGFPNFDETLADQMNQAADCFPNEPEPTFGFRIRATLVVDVSCDDLRYKKICEEEMAKSRVVNCPR